MLRRKLGDELKARGKPDFEPGERMRIHRPAGEAAGAEWAYWDADVAFEHAAPKRSAADLLGGDGGSDHLRGGGPAPDDDIPF